MSRKYVSAVVAWFRVHKAVLFTAVLCLGIGFVFGQSKPDKSRTVRGANFHITRLEGGSELTGEFTSHLTKVNGVVTHKGTSPGKDIWLIYMDDGLVEIHATKVTEQRSP